MLSENIVSEIRRLSDAGVGSRSIARTMGIARNTVKRYVRIARGDAPPPAARPRVLDDEVRALALELWVGSCARNATTVTRELHARGITITARSVQRVLRSMNKESTPPPAFEMGGTDECIEGSSALEPQRLPRIEAPAA